LRPEPKPPEPNNVGDSLDDLDGHEVDSPTATVKGTKPPPRPGSNGSAASAAHGRRKCRVSPENWADDEVDTEEDWDDAEDDAEDDWDDDEDDAGGDEEEAVPDGTNINDGFVGGAGDEAEEEEHEAAFTAANAPKKKPQKESRPDPEPEPPPKPMKRRRRKAAAGGSSCDPLVREQARKLGARFDPPCRRDDRVRYLARENWILDYLRTRVAAGILCQAANVASWILDRTRPIPGSRGKPLEKATFRRRSARANWIVFRRAECAHAVGVPERTVGRLLALLEEVGLVEVYRETKPPPPPEDGRFTAKTWYGPNTQVVRVRYELKGASEGGE
jgi:hypothetical protein